MSDKFTIKPAVQTDTEGVIQAAREKFSTDVEIDDAATVEQQPGGCWVHARVWVENVYIED